MSTLYDYPILASPTISLGQFTNVLVNAGSPAAGEAAGIYSAAVAKGVDPSIVLGIFQHESSFGKAGVAVGTQNGFGLRWQPGYANFGGVNQGGWAKFPSWSAGAQAVSNLLASSLYGGSSNHNTAMTFASRYAPSSDGNNPAAYGNAVSAAIYGWTGKAGTPVASSTVTPKVTAPAVAAPLAAAPAPVAVVGTGAASAASAVPAPRVSAGSYAIVGSGILMLALLIVLLR